MDRVSKNRVPELTQCQFKLWLTNTVPIVSFGISQGKITSRPKTIQYDQGCPTAQDTGEESSLKTDYIFLISHTLKQSKIQKFIYSLFSHLVL